MDRPDLDSDCADYREKAPAAFHNRLFPFQHVDDAASGRVDARDRLYRGVYEYYDLQRL